MVGVYTNVKSNPLTRVEINQVGSYLSVNMVFGSIEGELQCREVAFSDISFDNSSGAIEMFKDGKNLENSYYFTGILKEGVLQGQLADTSGIVMDLDLIKISSQPKQ